MKRNKIPFILMLLLSVVACDKYLDKDPDSRVTVDSADKVQKLLVSAYPTSTPAVVTEFSSDNIDDIGATNAKTLSFIEELVYWHKDMHEYNYIDGLRTLWEDHYRAIYHANTALEAITKLGDSPQLRAAKGEALVARAYAHFVLVNLFGKPYNAQTSTTDLGVPYIDFPINNFRAERPRNTVAEVYQYIEKDLTEGLPLLDDTYYKVPKMHFNKKAAYAFAARFYLYYTKWAKAEQMATEVLGDTPTNLRNWIAFQALGNNDPHAKEYTREGVEANLMLASVSSYARRFIDGQTVGRFAHSRGTAVRETFRDANNLWTNNYKDKQYESFRVDASKYIYTKYPTYTGNNTQIVLFTTDETLLIRAEARILQKNYTGAVADLNLFAKAYFMDEPQFTMSQIVSGYQNIPYSSYDPTSKLSHATQKKRLSPEFTIDNDQENLLHFLLQCRRLLTLGEGLRWYDIRRYGIEIHRHQMDIDGNAHLVEVLTKEDNRRTLPIPVDVAAAGMTQNPR